MCRAGMSDAGEAAIIPEICEIGLRELRYRNRRLRIRSQYFGNVVPEKRGARTGRGPSFAGARVRGPLFAEGAQLRTASALAVVHEMRAPCRGTPT